MATRYYWTGSGVTARANSTAYSSGDRIVPALTNTAGNGTNARRFVWECTTAGTTGASVPTWPASVTADSTTLTDGTAVFTARNPGYSSGTAENWTFATIYLTYALAAANAGGDIVLAHYTSQENITASATLFPAVSNIKVISVDKDSSNAPTPMGTGGWFGTDSAAYSITIETNPIIYFYGITFRLASSSGPAININTGGDLNQMEMEQCYFWGGCTGDGHSVFVLGAAGPGTTANLYTRFKNCTFRFGAVNQKIGFRQIWVEFENCIISSAGSSPVTLCIDDRNGGDVAWRGCDLSHVTGTLVGNHDDGPRIYTFAQCKFGANVTVLGTQSTAPNKSSAIAYVFDCSSGDTHTFMGYYDAFGSCVSDTGIYYTTGAAAQSWKITTTANCSYYTPFTSPFVDFYNTGTSSITPYFEILRDGSTTAYQTDEVWGEFFVKTTSGSTQSTPYNDRMTLLGTPADQAAGAGTGSWTGEAGSAWSGKIDSGSAVTPAENGHIRGRVVVGEPSITVYVDAQIRT